MPQFSYKGMQRDGVLTEGFLDASNRYEAMRQVEILGLKPVRLTEAVNESGRKNPAALDSPEPTAANGSGGESAGSNGANTERLRRGFSRTSPGCFPACWPPACLSAGHS
jgi:hypothetical protein